MILSISRLRRSFWPAFASPLIGLAALLCLIAAIPAFAAAPAVPPGPSGISGSVPNGVLRETLPNGLRVVVVPDRLAPVVTTQLSYLAGSNDAPPGFPGTAHALEHMMFRGSEGLDRDQLAEVGALLGGVYNASTTETVTQYYYTVPAADLGVALHIEALRMRGLSLNQADWEQERGAIEQEVSRDLSSPIYNYFSKVQSILFAGTPYENDALGTRPSFNKTDAALLRSFYERWYAPNNAILVIAGDVDPQAALAGAKAAFADIPRREVPSHATVNPLPVAAETLALPTNFPAGLIAIAYRMPGLKSRDFAAADILGDVLGSQRGALYGLVPAGRALDAQFSYQAKADVGFGIGYAGFPKGEDPAPLLADMRQVFAAAAHDGVPPELVEAAKRQELAQLAFENDSISGLARSWSRALAFQGLDSPEDIARAYSAVTVDDVNRLARTLLDPDHAVTAILTPDSTGRPVASNGFGGVESFNSAPDHPVTLPSWASAALATPHQPAPPELPDVSILPNGLRLVVQPEHVSHTVSVYGRVRQVTETQEPPGQDGVAALTDDLFSYGSASLDRIAFSKAIDDIAATERAGTNFSLKVLTPQFEPGMRLLAEHELHPAFPKTAFPVVRNQLARSLAGMLQSPDYLFSRALSQAMLPPDDPTLRQATPETVTSLTLADVHAYYAATYRPDLTTIVVVGDVTPEEARRVVSATFGDWQAIGPTPSINLPPVGPNKPSTARVQDPSSLQDSVILAQTLGMPANSPDRYALQLGNTILGSGFSSHLYRDLRIKTGYVYSVRSALSWSRTRGDYLVSFGADEQNVDKARDLVIRDIKAMQQGEVSDAELTRAKAQVLRRLPMQQASVPAIARLYLGLIDLDLPLDVETLAAQRYSDVTPAEIERVFAAYLRPDDFVQVIKGQPEILAP